MNFNDFKVFMINLKTWQGVFKIHTKEKSGILRAERLRDALYDIGFQLNTDIISILILRYMRRDGTLRLGDFVSAILHLTMAFGEYGVNVDEQDKVLIDFFKNVFSEVFKGKDLDQDGVIKLGLADWIKSALMC